MCIYDFFISTFYHNYNYSFRVICICLYLKVIVKVKKIVLQLSSLNFVSMKMKYIMIFSIHQKLFSDKKS